jgi:hypothetical protein
MTDPRSLRARHRVGNTRLQAALAIVRRAADRAVAAVGAAAGLMGGVCAFATAAAGNGASAQNTIFKVGSA